MLTQARVQELFRYDPETGKLFWRKRKGVKAGREAGTLTDTGYLKVCVDFVDYKVHRIIWLYCTGAFPEDFLDHINLNKADNRIENLRPATKSENGRNRPKQRDNVSGFKGVAWDSGRQKWIASIKLHGKFHFLGRYDDAAEAHEVYKDAARRLHGEFARAA
jgi:hypothetical protein